MSQQWNFRRPFCYIAAVRMRPNSRLRSRYTIAFTTHEPFSVTDLVIHIWGNEEEAIYLQNQYRLSLEIGRAMLTPPILPGDAPCLPALKLTENTSIVMTLEHTEPRPTRKMQKLKRRPDGRGLTFSLELIGQHERNSTKQNQ